MNRMCCPNTIVMIMSTVQVTHIKRRQILTFWYVNPLFSSVKRPRHTSLEETLNRTQTGHSVPGTGRRWEYLELGDILGSPEMRRLAMFMSKEKRVEVRKKKGGYNSCTVLRHNSENCALHWRWRHVQMHWRWQEEFQMWNSDLRSSWEACRVQKRGNGLKMADVCIPRCLDLKAKEKSHVSIEILEDSRRSWRISIDTRDVFVEGVEDELSTVGCWLDDSIHLGIWCWDYVQGWPCRDLLVNI